ncbi:hypothetical protein GLOTRDRAFT_97150 [Gloeophyllum trabeum ATCC 11539]|uniref:F-box domain-containing protein n=1 Tax=Gloeophyllum trabeum (strain ATCC 11539 / FP-39264 / Madison 617) TaxID=670483 RepID=S7R798_GLOTA|nr:uncharacterized protein GLOTRDRAFT_97150 [Gloeophyllum trabeum ATCC 11539]EPQ50260.1 hypothetical protein GLOTRDRAFT_97150 [Gloeophyllum trabeum ATCC 11539]
MLCSPARLLLLESLFMNLSACNVELDDLGELDTLLGLHGPGEQSGREFLEELFAPLLESAVNLTRLGLSGIRDLESFPVLRNALVASFVRTRTVNLTGRSLIELLGHALQSAHRTISLSRLFLSLMPDENWIDIWRLLEPCRNTLEYLAFDVEHDFPVPPLESCNPWPLMSELDILSSLLPVAKMMTSRTLRKPFPNLRHLRIPPGAATSVAEAHESEGEGEPEGEIEGEPVGEVEGEDEDEVEWRSLSSFSGHAITFASLGFHCQLTELRLDSDQWSLNAPRYPNTARHFATALRLAEPRCFSIEVFDVCTPFDEDLEDELCNPLLWDNALYLEYAYLAITEGPCCNRLLEFLVSDPTDSSWSH